MVRRSYLMGIIAVSLIGVGFATAQGHDRQQIVTAQERPLWSAIGLIAYSPSATGAVCTGTLVTSDMILTAAHCVSKDGVQFDPADIYFFAGWNDGASVATARGTQIVMADGADQKKWSLKTDMALVMLDAPIPADLIRPLPLAPDGYVEGPVDFVGYRRDARQFAFVAKGCKVFDGGRHVFGLGCEVVSGNSGSPVLQRAGTGWQIAGIIVSHGSELDGIGAYAIRLRDEIRKMISRD